MGGSECPALSPPSIPQRGALEQGTEPLTAPQAPQHWMPTALVCVHGVCVFNAVCVHFGWVKRRAQILSMGILGHMSRHWSYVTIFFSLRLLMKIQICITGINYILKYIKIENVF